MKENKLVELSMDFSVNIINLVKFLKTVLKSPKHSQMAFSVTCVRFRCKTVGV